MGSHRWTAATIRAQLNGYLPKSSPFSPKGSAEKKYLTIHAQNVGSTVPHVPSLNTTQEERKRKIRKSAIWLLKIADHPVIPHSSPGWLPPNSHEVPPSWVRDSWGREILRRVSLVAGYQVRSYDTRLRHIDVPELCMRVLVVEMLITACHADLIHHIRI